MHEALLSDRERLVLKQFLETGKFTDRMLKLRLKRNYRAIASDFELVKKVMERLET